jgi:hypothetical protein
MFNVYKLLQTWVFFMRENSRFVPTFQGANREIFTVTVVLESKLDPSWIQSKL